MTKLIGKRTLQTKGNKTKVIKLGVVVFIIISVIDLPSNTFCKNQLYYKLNFAKRIQRQRILHQLNVRKNHVTFIHDFFT